MKKNKLVNCPICNSNRAINLLTLNCGKLDKSFLYQFVRVKACKNCGHIYNFLFPSEIRALKKYYDKEYAPLNLSSPDKSSDRPGSENPFTIKRYTRLFNLISPYIKKDFRILDIGCAAGGFLHFLSKKGFTKLSGIDISQKYVDFAKRKGDYNVKIGSAESIPFSKNSFNLLIADQVIEHLVCPLSAFKEAKKVLVNGGLFFISTPDAARYNKLFFFDFYWFLLREHIQHFDIFHLKMLAEKEGFKLLKVHKDEISVMSKKMRLPIINAIFRLTAKRKRMIIKKKCFKLKKEIEQYIINSFKEMNKRKKIIDDLVKSKKPLYIWGIGREFLYLYENTGLKNGNIVALIDINPYKRKMFKVNGQKIVEPSVLKLKKANSVLIVTATAHFEKIKERARKIGYTSQILKI